MPFLAEHAIGCPYVAEGCPFRRDMHPDVLWWGEPGSGGRKWYVQITLKNSKNKPDCQYEGCDSPGFGYRLQQYPQPEV